MKMFGDLMQWFAGGPDGYMSLNHCMKGDSFWIALTIMLDLSVALGYVIIARHWWENEKLLPESQAKLALGNMKRIFLFCGTCGYLFIPIKLFWPAWRLYDIFMVALVFFTWRYALNAKQLRVVYHELKLNKQLASDLAASKEESRRKSFFLNAVSHDLRTPLNGLMLQAELAEMLVTTNDLDSLGEALNEIKACARTTSELLGSFLELGRLDWTEERSLVSRFPLDDLIGQVVARSRNLAELKGLRMQVSMPESHSVLTDRIKLERILQNLISNAIKFTDHGSVNILVELVGQETRISVKDSGVGIPEDQLITIFDEFYQVNNSERASIKGFGLGLSIAKRLTDQLHGSLVVESEVGRGSRFIITIPELAAGPAAHGHASIRREAQTSPAPG